MIFPHMGLCPGILPICPFTEVIRLGLADALATPAPL